MMEFKFLSVETGPRSVRVTASGGSRDASPPRVQILSFSRSFQQKVLKKFPFWDLPPPLQENPGSATDSCGLLATIGHNVVVLRIIARHY